MEELDSSTVYSTPLIPLLIHHAFMLLSDIFVGKIANFIVMHVRNDTDSSFYKGIFRANDVFGTFRFSMLSMYLIFKVNRSTPPHVTGFYLPSIVGDE